MKNTITKLAGHYVNTMARLAPKTAGRHGFRLFCYPARVPLKAHQKKFLATAEQFDFQHGSIRIQGYRWGQGPKKLLFLHGWQSHSFRWKNYIEALPKDEFSVYAIDAPGHGYSEGNFLTLPLYSQVIEALINSLGELEGVVSHSIGSFSMIYTLYRKPSLPVNKLIIMGAPGEVGDFIQFYKQTLRLSDRALAHTLDHFRKTIGKPVDYFSAASFAAELKIPGLIIHDKADQDAPYHYAQMVHKAWKDSHLLSTQGLGHNLKSPLVVAAVTDFLRGKTPQRLIDDFKAAAV